MYLAQSIDSCAEEKTCTKLVDLGFSSLDRFQCCLSRGCGGGVNARRQHPFLNHGCVRTVVMSGTDKGIT